jgi:hypothetical protein
MTPLPIQFDKSGWHYHQVFRRGLIAVYRRWKDSGLKPHFETIRIREAPDYQVNGNSIPAHESYPGDTLWGKHGWTFLTEEEAMHKASELTTPTRRVRRALAS